MELTAEELETWRNLGVEPLDEVESTAVRALHIVNECGHPLARAKGLAQTAPLAGVGPLVFQGGQPRGGWTTYIRTAWGLHLVAEGYGRPTRDAWRAVVQHGIRAIGTGLHQSMERLCGWMGQADEALDVFGEAMVSAGGERHDAICREC